MTKVLLDDSNLSAIGNAIREKTGSTDTYKPREMADAISAIKGGDPNCNGRHIPDEALVVTGDCSYRFANNGCNWFIEQCEDEITTKDITNAMNMFYFSTTLESIPFDINLKTGTNVDVTRMFYQCNKLKSIPYVKGSIGSCSYLFSNNSLIREIPEDWGDYLDFSYAQSYAYTQMQNVFSSCYSLRKIPKSLLSKLYSTTNTAAGRSSYANMFADCYALDEIKDIPINSATITSNFFSDTFNHCYRAKDITFTVQEDGSPYTVNWKNQTINIQYIGFLSTHYSEQYITTDYNSGITKDKAVRNAEDYAALKNDPDWYAMDASSLAADMGSARRYSRYNHDSAVNTINSLPITTNTGCVIKFTGVAGELTDGGAINTLTEEEIAVAAAKGWTVTFS
jgi:hypothetical protein